MSIAASIKSFLDTAEVKYDIVRQSGGQPNGAISDQDNLLPAKIAKPVVLKDQDNLIVTVIPSDHAVDLGLLQKHLNRQLQTIPARDYIAMFKNWMPSKFSPIAGDYGLQTIIDKQLTQHDFIFFPTENRGEYIRISGADFQRLHNNGIFDYEFSKPINALAEKQTSSKKAPVKEVTVQPIIPEPAKPSVSDIKERIEKITELPPMPEMAQKIVLLNANPYARAEDLARLVELDPSLAAQIVRYARSPFFGYRGQISSIKDAIARVLGYDMVMNIALGMAAASPFKIPKNGVLGLDAFWLHATFTAALTQELGKVVPKNLRPKPGITYLAGLLHNFGFLLLGHLFTDEFNALNKAVSDNPDTPVIDLEIELLGTSHTEIGAWLMKAWNMPEEVIVTLREHHNVNYQDKPAVYPNLVLLADRILKKFGMGDAAEIDLPETFIQKYNLNEMRLEPVINRFLEGREDLEKIARVLAA